MCGGRGEEGGSKGNLNAITDTAAVLYHCSETNLGHTFRYLCVYLGDPIQVDAGIHKKELPNVAQREVPTRVKGPFELLISLCQSRHLCSNQYGSREGFSQFGLP